MSGICNVGQQGPGEQHRKAQAALEMGVRAVGVGTGIRVSGNCTGHMNTCVFRLSRDGVIPEFLTAL